MCYLKVSSNSDNMIKKGIFKSEKSEFVLSNGGKIFPDLLKIMEKKEINSK